MVREVGNGLRVSVIVPAFNAERYIREALESALGQTVEVEMIVVDDGSTDGTAEIVQSFGDRVRLLRQSNARQAVARNAGVRVASSELLAFLDADDVWEPDKLERQLERLRADPALGLVYCSISEIDERGTKVGFQTARLRGRCYADVLLGTASAAHLGSTLLTRRQLFDELGGFDPSLPPCEDTDFFWRAAAVHPVDYVDAPLVRYRVHTASAHHDLRAMTRAWTRLYAKALNDPRVKALGPGFARQCEARLHYMLAGEHALAGAWPQALSFAVRALCAQPSLARRVLRRLWAQDEAEELR